MSIVSFLLLLALLIGWGVHINNLRHQLEASRTEVRRLRDLYVQSEARLQRRGRRLDVLLSEVNEVVLRVDRGGHVAAANKLATEVFRLGRHLPASPSMVLFYRDPEWHQQFMDALGRLPEPSILPEMHVSGKILAPRLAPLGKDQALLLCLDITEKHRLEQQRKTFLANLMHDLKTPLTAILGYARSLDSFADDPELQRESARVIVEESKYLNNLLEALLTLDKAECFRPQANARCNPLEVCRKAAELLEPKMAGRRISLAWQHDESAPDVTMAADDLHRVVTNVMENAIRYSPDGGTIHLALETGESNGTIRIVDEGPGVPDDELPHLTERFYRGDKARGRSNGSGHGLGLSIVRELVYAHHGSLLLDNGDEAGLSVEIMLPLAGESFEAQ